MRKKIEIEDLRVYFGERDTFTTEDLSVFLSKFIPGINKSAINWRIQSLAKRGVLKRIGRGTYAVGRGKIFCPIPDDRQRNITILLRRQLPLIKYSSWQMSSIREFHQHISVVDFLIIEVEQEAMDAVFHLLLESGKNIYKEPTKKIIEEIIIDKADSIVVKSMITESPLMRVDEVQVPTLEKILVDLFADKDLFYFLQGNELLHIFRNAMDKYVVNIDKVLRYARRRGKEEELREMLEQIKKSD